MCLCPKAAHSFQKILYFQHNNLFAHLYIHRLHFLCKIIVFPFLAVKKKPRLGVQRSRVIRRAVVNRLCSLMVRTTPVSPFAKSSTEMRFKYVFNYSFFFFPFCYYPSTPNTGCEILPHPLFLCGSTYFPPTHSTQLSKKKKKKKKTKKDPRRVVLVISYFCSAVLLFIEIFFPSLFSLFLWAKPRFFLNNNNVLCSEGLFPFGSSSLSLSLSLILIFFFLLLFSLFPIAFNNARQLAFFSVLSKKKKKMCSLFF